MSAALARPLHLLPWEYFGTPSAPLGETRPPALPPDVLPLGRAAFRSRGGDYPPAVKDGREGSRGAIRSLSAAGAGQEGRVPMTALRRAEQGHGRVEIRWGTWRGSPIGHPTTHRGCRGTDVVIGSLAGSSHQSDALALLSQCSRSRGVSLHAILPRNVNNPPTTFVTTRPRGLVMFGVPAVHRGLITTRGRRVPSVFTLIELLVVIAVIALLGAILFTVSARARARQTVCLAHLKQIGPAFSAYTQDFDGGFPNTNDPYLFNGRRWRWCLVPYFGVGQRQGGQFVNLGGPTSILLCPSDTLSGTGYDATSYNYSAAFYHPTGVTEGLTIRNLRAVLADPGPGTQCVTRAESDVAFPALAGRRMVHEPRPRRNPEPGRLLGHH